jgi:ABC-type glycerol-3-phosphate transport system permease component
MLSRPARKQINDFLQFFLILFAAVFIMIPIYWIISGAFKQQVDIFQLKLLFECT